MTFWRNSKPSPVRSDPLSTISTPSNRTSEDTHARSKNSGSNSAPPVQDLVMMEVPDKMPSNAN